MESTKQLLTWNDYLKTGIDIVDQQHRGLIDLTNEISVKLNAGANLSSGEMHTLLGFLTEYAATHFHTEEALMALSDIDERHVAHHRASHAGFLQQVNTMLGELGESGTLSGQQMVDFLGNWLIYHILGEDQRLSRLLQRDAGAPRVEVPSPEEAYARQTPLAQEAANRSLSKLYAFMAERNKQLQAAESAERSRSRQMMEMVNEQKEELEASEERFRKLFHNGNQPTLITGLDADQLPGPVIDANVAACALLGYSQPELGFLALQDFVAPDEIERFPLLISELEVTGKFECEMALITKAGLRIPTRMVMTQLVLRGHPAVMSIIRPMPQTSAAAPDQADLYRQEKLLVEIRRRFLAGLNSHMGRGPAASKIGQISSSTAAVDSQQLVALFAEHPLFKGIASQDLAKLAQATTMRALKKGEHLFDKGEPPRALQIVISGQVLLAVSAPQGGRKVLGIHTAGHSIGETEVVMNTPYPYFAESVDDSEVVEIAQPALLQMLDNNKTFARNLISCMGSRQHDLMYSVESYTLRTGAERVIGYLLQHAKTASSGRFTVRLPATKQLIASLLHITPETLSRIFRDLSTAGLIMGTGRQVQIPDVEKLIAYQA